MGKKCGEIEGIHVHLRLVRMHLRDEADRNTNWTELLQKETIHVIQNFPNLGTGVSNLHPCNKWTFRQKKRNSAWTDTPRILTGRTVTNWPQGGHFSHLSWSRKHRLSHLRWAEMKEENRVEVSQLEGVTLWIDWISARLGNYKLYTVIAKWDGSLGSKGEEVLEHE